MTPKKVLLFIYGIFLLLFILVIVIPESGWDLKCCKLNFVKLEEILKLPEHKELKTEVKKEIKEADKLIKEAMSANDIKPATTNDTLVSDLKDTVEKIKKVEATELKKNVIPIEFASEKDRKHFYNFFKKISHHGKKVVRVLYYGDSQIEADRITSFIRYKLQSKFGGYGPGMLPPVNFVKFFSMNQYNDGTWHRYSIMQYKKNGIRHNKYGILASFANYTADSVTQNHILTFEVAKHSYSNTRRFDKITLFYHLDSGNVVLKVFADGDILDFTSLQPSTLGTYSLLLPKGTKKVELSFTGKISPDLYSVMFDSKSGVAVDNIAIRGCSGTFFTKLDKKQLKEFFNQLHPALIVMEFGGNVLPYMNDVENCKNYGRYFSAQLRLLKSITNNTPVLVIGPADMSIKQNGDFITYPLLLQVRNELKKVAFENGAGFWDMYKAMGGKNSMPIWVKSNLATTDYTHFTIKGAVVIANMLNNAIMNEYYNFLKEK